MAAEQRLSEIDRKPLDERCGAVEAGSRLAECGIEIAAAIDLQLERVDAAGWVAVMLDHMAAGERIVEPGVIPRASRGFERCAAHPAVGGEPAAIAVDDRWRSR